MKTVAIIDYGMGNLHSARKAVEHVAPDCTVLVTDDAAKIREADRVILPGVGAIRDCMAEMHRLGVVELVKEVSQDRRSEEHTSELQSRENLVCRLLLEKKKTK